MSAPAPSGGPFDALAVNDEKWMADALCRQVDVGDVFFPDVGGQKTALEAARICANCDVRKQCLDFAVRGDIREGVWGGTTPNARRKIRRQLRKDEQRAKGMTA